MPEEKVKATRPRVNIAQAHGGVPVISLDELPRYLDRAAWHIIQLLMVHCTLTTAPISSTSAPRSTGAGASSKSPT